LYRGAPPSVILEKIDRKTTCSIAIEDAVTFLAIWFCAAVVVGVLLGYGAHRLKRDSRKPYVASNENVKEARHRPKLAAKNRVNAKNSDA
jgi:hypothetical protein